MKNRKANTDAVLRGTVSYGPLMRVSQEDARQFANVLALAYRALGLTHLDKAAR